MINYIIMEYGKEKKIQMYNFKIHFEGHLIDEMIDNST